MTSYAAEGGPISGSSHGPASRRLARETGYVRDSLASQATQRHGGEVEVKSVVGQGTRFTVDWPAARDEIGRLPP
jgi:sensor histidine kinase regulating citrate/malate metabolism